MVKRRRRVLAAFVVLATGLLPGCGTVYQVAKPDAQTGLLDTGTQVKPDEIKAFVPSARIHDVKFIYLRSASGGIAGGADEYDKFLDKELPQLGFPPLARRDDLAKLVVKSDLINTVGNVTDPVALAKLSKAIGPFLVLDIVQVYHGYAVFETAVRLTDPETTDTLVSISRVRTNWANLDKEVNYPVLNVLKRWLDASKALPASRPPPAAAAPTT
jgi:hypothetical protein